MQTVERLTGYKRSWWALPPIICLTILSGGILWPVARSFPQAMTWALKECSLCEAHLVLAKFTNKRQLISRVHQVQLSKQEQTSSPAIKVRTFKLLLVTYVYNEAVGTFFQLPPMPSKLPTQVQSAANALQAINQGADWSTLNPSSSWPRHMRSLLYGRNDLSAGKPSILSMAAEVLVHPMYLIQYAELAFTMYEGYSYYAGILLAITLISGFMSTIIAYRSRLQLYNSIAQCRLLPLVHKGYVRGVGSHRLMPGDIVVLLQGKATADMVILQGNCLVDESIMSGEVPLPQLLSLLFDWNCCLELTKAAQVRKVSFTPSPSEHQGGTSTSYNPDAHQTCTVYAGTHVQQVWNEQCPNEETLALVVRTGLCTAVGSMLRQVMAPLNATDYFRDPFVKDLYLFCSFALVLQLAMLMLYATKAAQHPYSAASVIKHAADAVISAVPTGIPTVIIFSLYRCVLKLLRHGTAVHRPIMVNVAADVDTAVFDKTGTLTDSVPKMHGMLPLVDGKFAALQQSAVQWPNSVKQSAAICNSLNLVNKLKMVGDVADYEAFSACEARFLGRNVVALPLKLKNKKSACVTTLTIIKRFEFEPQLLRSGVLAVASAGSTDEVLFFVKGAPASIEHLLGRGSVPQSYRQVIDEYSGQSFRLLALAKGVVQNKNRQALSLMSREELEKQVEHFELLGLLVLSNQLRPDSKDTIAQLQEQAGLRILMATGDYHFTALAVARGVGMIPPSGKVVIIQREQEGTATNVQSEALTAENMGPQLTAQYMSSAASPATLSSALKTACKALQSASPARQTTRTVSFAPQMAGLRGVQQQQHTPSQDLSLAADLFGASDAQQQVSDDGYPAQEQQLCSMMQRRRQPALYSNVHQGLIFQVDNGNAAQDDALEVLTAIAQGEAQCCVTGAAFEHMLQLGDQSLLDTVMRNVVVFSRMKSHQKGQVMDLLGSRGLHQVIDGQQQHLAGLGRTSLYCGDGVNDLLALAAADVGIAIGASDASAAAVFSTKQRSIQGLPLLLRECRAAQAIKLAAIKFMMLYELLLALMINASFFMDGSEITYRQRAPLDFMALSLGLVCCFRPARSQLGTHRPPQWLCLSQNFKFFTSFMLMSAGMCACYMWYLTIQPWYTRNDGSTNQSASLTVSWTIALCQVPGAPAMLFRADIFDFCKPYSLPEMLLTLLYFIGSTLAGFLGVAALDPLNYLGFYKYPWGFRWKGMLIGWAFIVLFTAVFERLRVALDCRKSHRRHQIMPSH